MQLPHTTRLSTYPAMRSIARTLLVALLFAGLGIGAGLAVRGFASDQSNGPLPLSSLRQSAAPLVVYSEFGTTADTIWAANPAKPSERTQLGMVPHALGYGIAPSVSPDGKRIAYTVAPPSGGPVELWVLDIDGEQAIRLATGVDLVSAPVWSVNNDALIVRRSSGTEGTPASAELLLIELNGAATTLVAATAGLYPIDLSPDGAWLYYAEVSATGTDLARVPVAGGAAETVAHLSDGIARDWQLAPDGTKLAYLAQTAGAGYDVRVVDVATGEADDRVDIAGAEEFSPIWTPNGDLTVGRLDGAALRMQGVSAAGAAELAAPDAGFDAPLTWSPDGDHLAVRAFEGTSANDPGPSRVVVSGPNGERAALSSVSDVTIAGWLAP